MSQHRLIWWLSLFLMLKILINFFLNSFRRFFAWYKRNYKLNLYITAFLLIWQLVHLYWMGTNVVALRLLGYELWNVGRMGNIIISLVDYTEIPALVLGSLFYINEFQKGFKKRSILLLIFLNIQWLHLFWITDEVVLEQFTGNVPLAMPFWLAWFAILIDYLELPIIYDTVKKSLASLRKSST